MCANKNETIILSFRNPTDMIHTSHVTAAEFACDYDHYGDSYYDDTTIDDLQKTFDKIPSEVS